MTNRLFISAEISEEIKGMIVDLRKKFYETNDNLRWENKSKLHFTLKFLGDVKIDKINDLISELEVILKNQKLVNCSFSKFGLFKKGDVPSILWIGIKHNPELIRISEKLNIHFEKHGFEIEKRKFKPHITLLRLKGFEPLNEINKIINYKLNNINFYIDEISLIKSELLRSGSEYTKIKSFKLNK